MVECILIQNNLNNERVTQFLPKKLSCEFKGSLQSNPESTGESSFIATLISYMHILSDITSSYSIFLFNYFALQFLYVAYLDFRSGRF